MHITREVACHALAGRPQQSYPAYSQQKRVPSGHGSVSCSVGRQFTFHDVRMPSMARYGIFSRLSSLGTVDLALVTLRNAKKTDFSLRTELLMCAFHHVWTCEPLCALLRREAGSCPSWLVLAGFGPLFRRCGGVPIRDVCRRISPQGGARLCRRYSRRRERILPIHGWGQAERLACRERLPNAFLRAEVRTHFAGQRPE